MTPPARRVSWLVIGCLGCGPGGTPAEADTGEPASETQAPVDLPPQPPCPEGLGGCEAGARTQDTACMQGCDGLELCAKGACRAQCGLETSLALAQCSNTCPVAQETPTDHACWSSCMDDSLACFDAPACNADVCAYLRFACTIPCSLQCFDHAFHLEYTDSCTFVLPAPIPIMVVPYTEVVIGAELIPDLFPAEQCGLESGWIFASEDADQIQLCGDACGSFAGEQGLTLSIGCPGEPGHGRP